MSQRLLQNILIGFGAVLLALGLAWGITAGSRAGKSRAILKQAESAMQGLEYFYDDHGRYPSTQEFQDQNLMLHYFSVFPLPNIPSGGCGLSFAYASSSVKTYELRFCLPKASGSFARGWNSVKSQ